MTKATPALLALLLVLSLPAMTGVAAVPAGETADGANAGLHQDVAEPVQPTIVTRPMQAEVANTTNRLQVTGEVRSEYTAYRSDLGLALANADGGLRIDHEQYAIVDREFTQATTEERAAMIQAAYDRLRQRAAALEQREREAVRAHAAGDLSTAQLLQTLLRNYNEAGALVDQLNYLEDRAVQVPGYSLSSVRTTKKIFESHRTAPRTRLSGLATTPSNRRHVDIAVSTSQTGYSLSLIEGDQYLVETTRFDNRDQTAPDQFEDREAFDQTLQLYPWAAEHGKPYFQDNSPDHYWTEFVHDQGQTEVYLDGGTGDVYREVQTLNAPSLPVTELGPWTGNGLNMTMNRTPTTGPVELTVTDQTTGEPVDATVTFDGVEIGQTGADGSLWIVPLRGSHKLEVTAPEGTVNATVTR